jgi:hypothetical protein
VFPASFPPSFGMSVLHICLELYAKFGDFLWRME